MWRRGIYWLLKKLLGHLQNKILQLKKNPLKCIEHRAHSKQNALGKKPKPSAGAVPRSMPYLLVLDKSFQTLDLSHFFRDIILKDTARYAATVRLKSKLFSEGGSCTISSHCKLARNPWAASFRERENSYLGL